jgi:hypothetical protein
VNALFAVVIGVLLLAGLHKLQGYLWRKNFERKKRPPR